MAFCSRASMTGVLVAPVHGAPSSGQFVVAGRKFLTKSSTRQQGGEVLVFVISTSGALGTRIGCPQARRSRALPLAADLTCKAALQPLSDRFGREARVTA